MKRLTHEPDIDTDGKDTARHREAGSVRTVGVTDDGDWFGTGDRWTLEDMLNDFARECDYALVEGFSESRLPKVSLGDRSAAPPVVATAADADDLALGEVTDIIETLPSYETPASLVAKTRVSLESVDHEGVATATVPVAELAPTDDVTARVDAANRRLRSVDGICEARVHHQQSLFDELDDVVHLVVLADDTARANEAIGEALGRLFTAA
ncbi:bifunctional molybdopterin-guanine dinucleotide biosynthesis protein MobB/MoaE [Halorubrum tebenquichense DSM 14210]|uniref:Bifunctional molybdopterin-guanine dinucleotide biosynthesis protein MobB/MoaE n=2 Tax=Halorubrum tebenquichense TaxID=119434 RepID=M0DDJ2_9EURY|nr:bifunctional molybdopterin-guanine dinucleotide biosynthesis protein MobB/MoaE [Halorubrum tebenquichense DSM 14210]